MKFKNIITYATLATMVLGFSQANAKTIKYAHFQAADIGSPKHAAALAFKQYVENETDLDVEIYPASQLGGDNEIMEGLQLGTVELAVVHDGAVSAAYKPFNVFAMPYSIKSQYEGWKLADSSFVSDMSEDMISSLDIRLIALADNGIRHFTNSKRPINMPEDMKGLKIRVQTAPMYLTLVEALSASPTSIAWPELPTALQQGVVDGQENGVTNIVNASLYQTQKYVTLDGHVYSWHAYLMNESFYQSLTDEEKEAVNKGIEIAKIIHRGMTAAQDANAYSILSGLGMEVTPLSDNQRKAFADITQPAIREWMVKEIGEEWVTKYEDALAAIN